MRDKLAGFEKKVEEQTKVPPRPVPKRPIKKPPVQPEPGKLMSVVVWLDNFPTK